MDNILFNNERLELFTEALRLVEEDTHTHTTEFFPFSDKILRSIPLNPKDVKCVFLGMEPYASWFYDDNRNIVPEATGRSFEVASVSDWNQKFKQSSLRNILKSLYFLHTGKDESLDVIREKIDSGEFPISQPHEWFDRMEEQGVVFLNASLTVRKDKPDTHTHLWEPFMNSLIKFYNSVNPGIIWILAGNTAQNRALRLVNRAVLCPHPRVYEFVKACPFESIKDVEWIR